jgi:hypothetical protein
MAYLSIPELIDKLIRDQGLTALEREFLAQVCYRLYCTDELDHVTESPKTH